MKEGFDKFRELLLTDEEFRAKLQKASETYTGDQTEEAVFNNVLVPLAAEYGITETFEEFKTHLTSLEDRELSSDEIAQISGGGKGSGGIGANLCLGIGVGGGITKGTLCAAVGFGDTGACAIEGAWVDFDE